MTSGPKGFGSIAANRPSADEEAGAVDYDAATFFDQAYQRDRAQTLTDRATIGPFVSEIESRFHFNATENSILRALARLEPAPAARGMIRAWEFALSRKGARLFDLGSGSGHWISFFREIGRVSEALGCEIAPRALAHLRTCFADSEGVAITDHDLALAPLPADLTGVGFDYVSAIGVMFHIVDDECWRRAVLHLAALTKPGGVLFIGGEFGAQTRNVNFHADDLKPMADAKPEAGKPYRVSKRVRSLAQWQDAWTAAGLVMADLIRTDGDSALAAPENDVLVLRRPD